MFKKIFGFGAALVLMALVAVAVFALLETVGGPVMRPVTSVIESVTGDESIQVVKPYTTVRNVREYEACGDVELYSREPADEELVGLDHHRLQMKYPAHNGWDVSFRGEELTLTRKVAGYCGLHREYRHLGIYDGLIAVYQGPLGNDGTLLRLERNIRIDLLPADWRANLEKAAGFNELSFGEQAELRQTLEFTDDNALNLVLENFDEMDSENGI